MKIAVVLRCFTRKGSCRYAVEVFTHFVRKGHEVHIYSNSWDKSLEETGMTFHKIPAIKGNFFLQEVSFMLLATAMLKLKKYDLVYSQPGRFFSPDIAGVHICATKGIIGCVPSGLSEKLLYMIEKHNLKKCRKVIAVSNRIKSELMANYAVLEGKISVIHNGINLKEFFPAGKGVKSEIREKFNIPSDAFVLLFVGNPFSRKGLEHVIRAMPLIAAKHPFLFIVGNDDITPYEGMIKELQLEGHIKHIRSIGSISEAYWAADVFVFPTLYEPFGLVISEAMASGLPVVTSGDAGAAEIMEDGKDGLLLDDPRDPKHIADKVNLLVNNIRLGDDISKSALDKVRQYSWDIVAQKWLDVFLESRK